MGTVTGSYVANGISKIALGENASQSSGIQASSNGATLKFTVSTPTGFTIKTVRFKDTNVNESNILCNDATGTLTTTSHYTTLTASADKTSIEFTVPSSASDKKAKLTEFVVTVSSSTTDDYELVTPQSVSGDDITFNSSLGDDKLVTAMTNLGASVSASCLDFGNGKGFSISTSRAIKAIYCVWYQRQPSSDSGFEGYSVVTVSGTTYTYSSKIGTYTNSTNAWVAPNENTKFVAFKRTEGSSAKLSSVHIFYYDSTVPSISSSNVSIFENTATAGEIGFSVTKLGTTGSVTAATTADWLTLGAVDNENGKVPFTLTANTSGNYRSATVTLTYTYNTSETVTKDVTVTQSPDFVGSEIIKLVLKNTVTGAIGGTADVLSQDRDNEKGGCKLGSKGHYAGFTLANSETFRAGDIVKVNIGTDGLGKIIFYDSKEQTNVILSTDITPTAGLHTFVLPAAANGQSSLYLVRGNTLNDSFNPYIDYISVSRPASGTISASGWNTFSCNKKLDLNTITNGKAYVATATSGSNVTLTECTDIVAAGTGLMIKGTTDDIFTIQITDDDVTYTGDNLLVGLPTGGTVAVAGSGNNYVFGWSDPADPGFYLVNSTEPALGAGKAYLHTTAALGARLFINFEDENVTGIQSIENGKSTIDNAVYDLSGRRVAQPTKGLYIVNGKKVVIK